MIKFIDNINTLKEKRVILRTDYNVPLEKNKIKDDLRIKKSINTINHLWNKKVNTIIIISHLGRPDRKNKKYSLIPIYKKLKKLLKQDVYFEELFSDKMNNILKKPKRKIILCENIRFFKNEIENDNNFSKKISSYGDIFVNDAFATCHRKNSSTYGITKYLPSYGGLLIKEELTNLNKIIKPKKPFVWIIGGVKKEKETSLQQAIKKADNVLVGSGVSKSKCFSKNIIFPLDSINGKDIGLKTITEFKKVLSSAKTIFWNGPLGKFEIKKYSKGTIEIAKFISKLDCIKIIGGGETAEVIKNLNLSNKMTFISTGGGASLKYILEGKLLCLDKLRGKV